jgi:hypothetical protein
MTPTRLWSRLNGVRFSAWAAVIGLCAATGACGGKSPTQPVEDGCTVISASPAAGSQLTAGVTAAVTLTARCVAAHAGASAIIGGIVSPSNDALPSTTVPIREGTVNTVTLTLKFVPPEGATAVHVLIGVIYASGDPGVIRGPSIDYVVGG